MLAREGGRGLTHRAVDREADLPEGSSSAYFRSRSQLVTALADRVATRLAEDVAGLSDGMAEHPGDHAWAVEATTALFTTWLAEPGHVRARLELTLMATRDPALAAQLQHWRDDLVGLVAVVLDERGTGRLAVDPPVLVAAFEGLLLASLLQPEDSRAAFARAGIEQLLEVRPHVSPDGAPD